MSAKRPREDDASQAPAAKRQKGPTPEPPSLNQHRVEVVAQPAVEDDEENDDDDDDDEYWSGEEDFVFENLSEEEIQEKADSLCEEIRVALCKGMVWKPSCVTGNSSIQVEAKADHYQIAIRAFAARRDPEDEIWTGMHLSTEAFNEIIGPIHNLTGSTPLALTGRQVRINLYDDGEFTTDAPWQKTITVIVNATYGTHEARDRLQDKDVLPSDIDSMFSSDDDYSLDNDLEEDYLYGKEAQHEEETEDAGELDPSVH